VPEEPPQLLIQAYSRVFRLTVALAGLVGLLWLTILVAILRNAGPTILGGLLVVELVFSVLAMVSSLRGWFPSATPESAGSFQRISDRQAVEWLGYALGFATAVTSGIVSGLGVAFGSSLLLPTALFAVPALGVAAVVLTALFGAKSVRAVASELTAEARASVANVGASISESNRVLTESFTTNTNAMLAELGRALGDDQRARERLEQARRQAEESSRDAARARIMPRLAVRLRIAGGPAHNVFVDVYNEGMEGHNLTIYLKPPSGKTWEARRGSIAPSEQTTFNFGDVSRFPRAAEAAMTVECHVNDSEGREYIGQQVFSYLVNTNVYGWTISWRVSPPDMVRLEMRLVGAA
jgi:hypothetical protein